MSDIGASGPGDHAPADCHADGPLDAGRSVVDAVECGSARFLTLTHSADTVTPTYLVLTAADDPRPVTLSATAVLTMPEIQNAVAYYGSGVESVRVQIQSERRAALREHVAALRDDPTRSFEFAGRQFDLEVVLG